VRASGDPVPVRDPLHPHRRTADVLQITPLDIIVALIIGSNISRAMTGKAPFFPGLAATLVVVLHRLLAMATLRWSPLARLMKGAPIVTGARRRGRRSGHARHAIGRADLVEGLRMEQVDA
jgi:hypothetical protein